MKYGVRLGDHLAHAHLFHLPKSIIILASFCTRWSNVSRYVAAQVRPRDSPTRAYLPHFSKTTTIPVSVGLHSGVHHPAFLADPVMLVEFAIFP